MSLNMHAPCAIFSIVTKFQNFKDNKLSNINSLVHYNLNLSKLKFNTRVKDANDRAIGSMENVQI